MTWSWILSKAGGDLVLIQTSLLFICRSYCSCANYLHLHMKRSQVCIKTRSTRASLPIQDQVTKHTTVKWPIECFHSRDYRPYWFTETKESICIKIEFNSQRFSLGHQHGRHFFVLGHQYGRHRHVKTLYWRHSCFFFFFFFFLKS